ncbi:hypothetical protein [Hydromonas duriensis]|uniref:YubB ferredoxin-like domain-containing protein n=1 Tax=Hydromonas duriensis TaxID=1527608 RepID=A0A4R6Y4S3_9BURK|nr:hypothetical protein [Hydromonas duriensis]TDR28934.1 hypothetical protein DFR44_1303 [Hydromonas duriensis]
MPNYCQNLLSIKGAEHDINNMIQNTFSIHNENCQILDFDKVVPMPKSLNIDALGVTKLTRFLLYPQSFKGMDLPSLMLVDQYADALELPCPRFHSIDDFIRLLKQTPKGRRYLLEGHYSYRNQRQYGYTDWYEWRIKHWGTKWGAMHFDCDWSCDNEREYSFDTAWSPPVPMIEALAEQYPQLTFKLIYVEEGAWFAGVFEWSDGCVTYKDEDADVKNILKTYHGYSDEDFEVDKDN